ncbi:MAG: hypothetical protein KC657_03035 [Myxococcales bacterium]|nr:hypothetical protein [Myxococcales bacterium]
MRRALVLTLALSAGVHAAVLVRFAIPRAAATGEPAETSPATPESAEPAPLFGETFELPAPELADPLLGGATQEPPSAPAPDPEGESPRPQPRPAARALPAPSSAPAAHGEGAAGSGTSSVYGAVGDRSAVDLATAFTRGFPQAASADPVWRTVPLGDAGTGSVRVVLDEEGRVESAEVSGQPSPALAAGIRRTIALLRARRFTSRGRVTVLSFAARITPDSVHDGLHGDVFAIGGSFAGGEGQAFFALATGRRIDVRVRIGR